MNSLQFDNIEDILQLYMYNVEMFLDFMSHSAMNHIDGNQITTTDLYVYLSRMLGVYNMFIKYVLILNDEFQIACTPRINRKVVKESSMISVNRLIRVEQQYGSIPDTIKYLMNKLLSYKFKTLIDNKINKELWDDPIFSQNVHRLAMINPIFIKTLKDFI